MTGTLMSAADRWKPLTDLLLALVDRVAAELPGCLGVTLSVRHGEEPLRVLVSNGVGRYLVPAQLAVGGPVPEALETGRPVTTDAVFTDKRWPALTEDVAAAPEARAALSRTRGLAALPGQWEDDGTFVLSAALEGPAGAESLAVLRRFGKLTEMVLVVGEAAAGGDAEQILGLLASRAAIEQAKGAIMAVRRCSSDEAWETLRRTSQEFNVKLRELAVALVEYVGGETARQPAGTPEIHPVAAARHAAERLWTAFTTP